MMTNEGVFKIGDEMKIAELAENTRKLNYIYYIMYRILAAGSWLKI